MRQCASALLALALTILGVAPAVARDPAPASIHHIDAIGPQRSAVYVVSPAMGRIVRVDVLHPRDAQPRPTLYLLDGVESPPAESTWTVRTDVERFVADKKVNVVLPVGGSGSYYTNWQQRDPILGTGKWETFLTAELPALIDKTFHGNGRNAIAGLSMGGQAALTLAARNPRLYRAVAAYSTCPDTSLPDQRALVRATVVSRGGNPFNMWGAEGNPAWEAHNPFALAPRLRGVALYVSVGSGVPGPLDFRLEPDAPTAISFGAPLEFAARVCTERFERRLTDLNIPARFVYRPEGVHSWPHWQLALHDSWPTLIAGLGS